MLDLVGAGGGEGARATLILFDVNGLSVGASRYKISRRDRVGARTAVAPYRTTDRRATTKGDEDSHNRVCVRTKVEYFSRLPKDFMVALFSPVATRSAAILPRAYSRKASNLMKRLHATSMLGVRHCELLTRCRRSPTKRGRQ